MLTRSQLEEIRAQVVGRTSQEDLAGLVCALVDEAEHERDREYELRAEYAALLEAARAAVAASELSDPDPTGPLKAELDRRGLLPLPGTSPSEAMADTAGLGDLLKSASRR